MDRVFLDANVLFSAAYRPHSGLLRLWELEGVQLVSSAYAVEEARCNLQSPEREDRLTRLAESLEIYTSFPPSVLLTDVTLPEKDRPILLAAVHTRSTHLLTGDVTHFGKYFGQTLEGVLILAPADYLHQKGV